MSADNAVREDLTELRAEIVALGQQVDEIVGLAIDALSRDERSAAQAVVQKAGAIILRRAEIEEECMRLSAGRADLDGGQLLSAVVHILSELEWIGNEAAKIARISLTVADEGQSTPLAGIPEMAGKVRGLLRESLAAMRLGDGDAAGALVGRDDEIDALHGQVYRDLLSHMLRNPGAVAGSADLFRISFSLEKMGDRITSICGWIGLLPAA